MVAAGCCRLDCLIQNSNFLLSGQHSTFEQVKTVDEATRDRRQLECSVAPSTVLFSSRPWATTWGNIALCVAAVVVPAALVERDLPDLSGSQFRDMLGATTQNPHGGVVSMARQEMVGRVRRWPTTERTSYPLKNSFLAPQNKACVPAGKRGDLASVFSVDIGTSHS